MSKEVFGTIAARWSCTRFRPIETDKLLQCVQAAALAPSSGNIQNWSFTIVTDIDMIRQMYHHTLEQEAFLSAMAAVIVCGDVNHAHTMYGLRGKRLYTVQNCAAAIENLLLASTALGIASLWVGAFDEDAISEMFGIPNEKHRPQAILLFGYPAEEPKTKDRRKLQDIVFWNKFGNRIKRPHLMYLDWATEWRNYGKKIRAHLEWAMRHRGREQEEHVPKGRRELAAEQVREMKEKSIEHLDKAKKRLSDVFRGLKKR